MALSRSLTVKTASLGHLGQDRRDPGVLFFRHLNNGPLWLDHETEPGIDRSQ